MAILRCPGCKTKFRAEPGPDGKVNCPSCGRRLQLPNSEPKQATPPRQWEVLDISSNTVYGPYTDDEMNQFVSTGRIVAESMVRHPVETLGAWMPARATELLRDRFAQDDTYDESTEPASPEPAGVHFEHDRSRASGSPPKARLQSRGSRGSGLFLIDFIDPTFRYYLTPTIVSITWVCFLTFTVIGFAYFTAVQAAFTFSPIVESENQSSEINQRRQRLPTPPARQTPLSQFSDRAAMSYAFLVIRVVLTLLSILWMRVILECVIVLFHISNSLKSIDAMAKKRLA